MKLVNTLSLIRKIAVAPAIRGRITLGWGGDRDLQGPFYKNGNQSENEGGCTFGSFLSRIYFDASRCSSIYNNTENILRPLSLSCKFAIRY